MRRRRDEDGQGRESDGDGVIRSGAQLKIWGLL